MISLDIGALVLLAVALLICWGFYQVMEKLREGKSIGDTYDIRKDVASTLPDEQQQSEKDEGDRILIGTDTSNREVTVPASTNHFYVAGTTGTGKTVMLSNFIKASVEYDYPMLIIDGKGDTGKGSILDAVTQMKGNKTLYVIDLNSPDEGAKYNPFKDTPATVVKDMLINLSDWSEEHYKLNTERYLQRVIELMMATGVPMSLPNIVDNIPVDEFIVRSKLALGEGVITKKRHLDNLKIAETSGKISEEAMARFSTIAECELGVIFDESGIDIISAIRENAIILFVLNPLLYPELSSRIAKLVVVDSKKAVSHLYRENQGQTFFIFDEVNVYCTSALLDLVNKSRSADVTCVLASQTPSDFDSLSPHFKNQIIENCNNYLILRQNTPDNAEDWARTIGTREVMDVTYQLHMDDKSTTDTGGGSAKKVREFIFHPDEIKSLKLGQAFYVNKNTGYKTKIKVNKPF